MSYYFQDQLGHLLNAHCCNSHFVFRKDQRLDILSPYIHYQIQRILLIHCFWQNQPRLFHQEMGHYKICVLLLEWSFLLAKLHEQLLKVLRIQILILVKKLKSVHFLLIWTQFFISYCLASNLNSTLNLQVSLIWM